MKFTFEADGEDVVGEVVSRVAAGYVNDGV